MLWNSQAFSSIDAFTGFLHHEEWNIGGDRVWIAPEIQFHATDRKDLPGKERVPAAVDPGSYALEDDGGRSVHLQQEMVVAAHVLASGRAHLRLERVVRPSPDPLRTTGNQKLLASAVRFAGYEQVIVLAELSSGGIVCEPWVLAQVPPRGVLAIPTAGKAEYCDYFEPAGPEHHRVDDAARSLPAARWGCRPWPWLRLPAVLGSDCADLFRTDEEDWPSCLIVDLAAWMRSCDTL